MTPPRPQTSAKKEAARQAREHGEALLGKDGRVNPAAVYRAAARKGAGPSVAGQIQAGPHVESASDRERAARQSRRAAASTSTGAIADAGVGEPAVQVPAQADEVVELAGDDEELVLTAPPAATPGAGPDQAAPEVTFTLQRDLDKRLDKYLVDRITFMSRNKLQELIDAGGVTVNGRAGKASTKLRLGDVVVVRVPPPPAEDFEPQDIPLDVMFEDEHLIVLNKQADFIVHPARTHTHGTMINALAYHFRFRSAFGGGLSEVGRQFARPGVVHRLDRHTSGCIVFAKSEQAHWHLGNQFMNRTVDKRYVAVTHGHVAPAIDVIDDPLGPHPSREKGYREKYVVRHDHLGKPAVTIYRVLAEYGQGAGARGETRGRAGPPHGLPGAPARIPTHKRVQVAETVASSGASGPEQRSGAPALPPMSLVEVELKTGRTHQIRVHFSHRGYPLVGDDMYGGKPVAYATGNGSGTLARQALHAAVLEFRHPMTGSSMRFVAPLPEDLRGFIGAARAAGAASEFPSPPGSVLKIDELLAEPSRGGGGTPA